MFMYDQGVLAMPVQKIRYQSDCMGMGMGNGTALEYTNDQCKACVW